MIWITLSWHISTEASKCNRSHWITPSSVTLSWPSMKDHRLGFHPRAFAHFSFSIVWIWSVSKYGSEQVNGKGTGKYVGDLFYSLGNNLDSCSKFCLFLTWICHCAWNQTEAELVNKMPFLTYMTDLYIKKKMWQKESSINFILSVLLPWLSFLFLLSFHRDLMSWIME